MRIDTRANLNALKRQVEELHRLRQETTKLRETLLESMELLQRSLRTSVVEVSPERNVRANVLSFPSKKAQ
jgi:hypothetical protein